MSSRTAVRRSAVVGLGALGALTLSAPAYALDATLVEQAVDTTSEAVAPAVDPLTSPLRPAAEGTVTAVTEATGPVTGDAAPGPTGGGTPEQVGGPAPEQPAQPVTPADETPAAPTPAKRTATTAPAQQKAAGVGVASMPSSLARSLSAPAYPSMSSAGGFGSASNPMSLFGAPQLAPPVQTSELPAPLAITPAGGELADVFPVDAPAGLPGALVALACTVVAGAVSAHVAALRSRREATAVA